MTIFSGSKHAAEGHREYMQQSLNGMYGCMMALKVQVQHLGEVVCGVGAFEGQWLGSGRRLQQLLHHGIIVPVRKKDIYHRS